MNDELEKFQTSHECPKCANSYFNMNIQWMDTYTKTVYTCDSCNWSCVAMSSCTSPASAPAPSFPNQSIACAQPVQTK